MADITMCGDEECPKKESCHRWTAPVNTWGQSYFTESPRVEEECEYFWNNKEE